MKLDDIKKAIYALDKDGLKEISTTMKIRWRQLSEIAVNKFKNGDWVSFEARGGKPITGVVRGLTANNKKTVPVVEKSGKRWVVSPSFLTKVKGGEQNVVN